MASPSSEIIECPVCFSAFDPTEHIPKMINCGHTFCIICLEHLIQSRGGSTISTITCPQCKVISNTPKDTCSSFPTNFAILQNVVEMCPECKESPISVTCSACPKRLCEGCLPAHAQAHAQATQQDLKNLHTASERLRQPIVSREMFQTANKEFDDIKSQVNVLCDDYIQTAEKLRKTLTEKADQLKHDNTQAYKFWQKKIYQVQGEVQSFILDSEVDIEDTPGASIDFDNLKKMKEQCEQFLKEIQTIEEGVPTFGSFKLHIINSNISTDIFNSADIIILAQQDTKMVSEPTVVSSAEAIPHSITPISLAPSPYKEARFMKEVGGQGSDPVQFNGPCGLVCLPSGMVAVTDQNNHRVQVLDQDLQYAVHFGRKGRRTLEFNCCMGIAIDSQHSLYIADCYNHRVHVVNEQGDAISCFGAWGSGPSQFHHPRGLAIDQSDNLYVCDYSNNRVQVLTRDGMHMSTLVKAGSGKRQLKAPPISVSVHTPTKKVVVTDMEGNVYIFHQSGKHVKTLDAGKPGGFLRAGGAIMDQWGNLVVCDREAGCLVVLDGEDQLLGRVGSQGDGPGQLKEPFGVTLTDKGHLLVCDWGGHKVVMFEVPE